MKVPAVAFLVFNRPAQTAKVYRAIRRARPARLLVVADGPRAGRAGDAESCAKVRALIRPDWPCKVQRLYSDSNLGCGARISSGLDWVFRQVTEAVILEDDCLPAAGFFRYASQLLALYRRDERVQMLAGSNFAEGHLTGGADWGFSRYPFIWGWATWRRAWRHYDKDMPAWLETGPVVLRCVFGDDRKARLMWGSYLWSAYEGRLDTWDYQWIWSIWRRQGLCAVPARNLISNIGAGPGATHGENRSANAFKALRRLPRVMRAPCLVEVDAAYDARIERQIYSGNPHYDWRFILRWQVRGLWRALAGRRAAKGRN